MLKECEVSVMMLPPPALCDSLEKPEKQKAIAEHQTRFKIIVCVCNILVIILLDEILCNYQMEMSLLFS